MKKLTFASFIVGSLFIGDAKAAGCGNLPEGYVSRIDQVGGALAKAKIQDQDGLGTCYANQASTMLQAVIPGNPDLSYLNLAVYYAKDTSQDEDQNAFFKTIKGPDGEPAVVNLVDNGFGCEAINSALKRQNESNHGVLCKTEDTALEHNFFSSTQNGFIDREHRQEKTMTEASRYYGNYLQTFGIQSDLNKNIKKRKEADQFAQAIRSFVNREMDGYGKKICGKTDPQKIETIISNAMTKTLGDYPHCVNNGKLVKKINECKIFDDLGIITNLHSAQGKRIGYLMAHSVRQKFTKELPAIINMSSGGQELKARLTNFMLDNVKTRLSDTNKSKFIANLNKNFSELDTKFLTNEHGRVVKGNISDCLAEQYLEFFKDADHFLAKAKNDPVLCNYGPLLENVSSLASALPTGAIKSVSEFINVLVLKDNNLQYDNSLMGIIANDCKESDRIKIPKSIKCEVTLHDIKPEVAKDKNKLQAFVTKERTGILSQIEKGLPVGLDLCTRYWYDPNFKFNQNSFEEKYSKCKESGKHGIHAVTMVGYRCKNNKLQYLAQNSWGPHWTLQNKKFEIEKGKIWLDEEELFMNILRSSKISK